MPNRNQPARRAEIDGGVLTSQAFSLQEADAALDRTAGKPPAGSKGKGFHIAADGLIGWSFLAVGVLLAGGLIGLMVMCFNHDGGVGENGDGVIVTATNIYFKVIAVIAILAIFIFDRQKDAEHQTGWRVTTILAMMLIGFPLLTPEIWEGLMAQLFNLNIN